MLLLVDGKLKLRDQTPRMATTANDISAIVAPRVARFGVRVTW